jgi:putative ABC transport system permease protein
MTQSAVGTALRNLRRAPAFTGLVVLTLALGIGATTAMFSVVDAVLLNPLPYPNADRFGEVQTVPEKGSRRPGASTAVLNELSRHTDLFTAVGAYQFGSANLTGSGEPEIVGTSLLSPSMLAILGVQPSLGNWFTDADAAAGNAVLLSERYWISRFGADPLIVGRSIMLDDQPHRVVGVMPNRFRFPEGNFLMWRPMDTRPTAKPRPAQVITVRRPELSQAQVNDRLRAMTPDLRAAALVRPTDSLAIDDLMQVRFSNQRGGALYILFGAVGLVMLVACVNVMNLLLVRSSIRSGEFALRSALGASGGSLVRSVLLESVLLAAAGGVAGIALGRGLLSVILATAPPQMTFLAGASEIDARALGFAIALAIVTCVLFGVLPAWRAVRIDAIDAIKQRATNVAGSSDDWWQGALVTAQLALVLVLLAGSGLLLRSFGKLVNVDPGFTVDELAVVDVQLPSNRYATPGSGLAFMQELERRVEETGLHAAISGGSPPKGGGIWFDIKAQIDDGRIIDLGPDHLFFSPVGRDYFSVMGIPLVDGRTFDPADPPNVAIVGSLMAARFFGDASAVGRQYRLSERQAWTTVIGVAADVKQLGPNESRDSAMEFYQPYSPATQNTSYSFVVRAPAQHGAALQMVKQKLWELDPKLPVISASTMPDRISESIARPRFYVALSAAFAITGALLAAIGVYGISAYWVSRRKRELAIRIALGASSENVVRIVMTRSLKFAAFGALAGLALAVAGTRLIESMLFETSGRDPVTLGGVTLLLGMLVVIGCLVPAIRASRVDPMTTLRAE